ncbi:MAG TPA: MOSC domain-containing protein [Candidatus Binatia bacterium]|nr:MOSC domain-containing protein [Candidatus Binatia bacterium]
MAGAGRLCRLGCAAGRGHRPRGRRTPALPDVRLARGLRPDGAVRAASRGDAPQRPSSDAGGDRRPRGLDQLRRGGTRNAAHGDPRGRAPAPRHASRDGRPRDDRPAVPRPRLLCLLAFEAVERIRADGHEAFPGAYGENLTVAGLDWRALRAGDRLEIGPAGKGPHLELTDYASPCDQQARWFVDGRYGRISAKRFPEDARWYARTIREGPVRAGDEIRLIRTA